MSLGAGEESIYKTVIQLFGEKDVVMRRDYSEYSIPELQEALAQIDGRRYPQNKSALEAELQGRRDSGEFDRYLRSIEEAREQEARDRIHFAKKMQKPIAAYLVVSAISTLPLLVTVMSAADSIVDSLLSIFFTVLSLATLVAGIGLFRKKAWSYWVAYIVLAFQVVKVQSAAVAFCAGSLFHFYIFVSNNPDSIFGFNFELFDPELTFAFGLTPPPPIWVGVNVIAVLMIALLGQAQSETD